MLNLFDKFIMKRITVFVFSLLAIVLSASCSKGGENTATKGMNNPPKHVVLIGFDGLSSYCLNNGARYA